MATHDYNLANQSGASFRSDLNNCLAAILSSNSNGSAPSTTVAYSIWADTTAAKLKIRNSANDGFVDLINLDGTIARDLTLTGTSANIVFDQSDNALEFADNALATFGDGADLTISHNGSNNIINDSGVGELQLQRAGNTILALTSSGIEITDPDGTAEVKIKGFEGGNANLILVADEGDDNGDQWIISSTASDNTLQIYNDESGGNVNKFTITTAGNVGIGTTSPSRKLHVVTAENNDAASIVNTGGTNGYGLNVQGGGSASGRYILRLAEAGGTEKFRVTSSGRVGIGTSSPSVLLDLESTDPTIRLTDSDASGTPECQISGGGGDLTLSADRDDEKSNTFIYFQVDGSTKQEMDSNGNIRLGSTFGGSTGTTKFHVTANSNGSTNLAMRVNNSDTTSLFSIREDGFFVTGNATNSPYNITTSSGANVFIHANTKSLRRSTSSVKYKKDIADATWGLAEVLKLRPVTFKSNGTGDMADDQTYGGFTAEDVHDAGLTEFVQYNENNEPDALSYGHMVALLTNAIKELSAKITALEGS